MKPISLSGLLFLSSPAMEGNIPYSSKTLEGMSGALLPQVVNPCNSGPAPMFMEAQLAALALGNTVLASRLQEPRCIMDCITGSLAFLNAYAPMPSTPINTTCFIFCCANDGVQHAIMMAMKKRIRLAMGVFLLEAPKNRILFIRLALYLRNQIKW